MQLEWQKLCQILGTGLPCQNTIIQLNKKDIEILEFCLIHGILADLQ